MHYHTPLNLRGEAAPDGPILKAQLPIVVVGGDFHTKRWPVVCMIIALCLGVGTNHDCARDVVVLYWAGGCRQVSCES